ncbi:MAG: hypothetical protein II707_07635 [Spirochaetales bacterium]|nr:hypothetical protein [Spirochaetales bacterium]
MKKHFVLIILLLTSLFAYAEDDDYLSLFGDSGSSDSSEETQTDSSSFGGYDFSAIPDFKLSLFGDHEAEFRMPVLPDYFNFDSYIKAPKFRNNLGIEVNYKSLKLVSSFKFDIILKESVLSGTPPNQWQEILNVMPMENYISWSPWKIKFAAGLQTFSWGAADGMNPTDNINPRDYRFGADSEKIPILSAAFSMYPVDWFSFDLVYVPFEQDNYFPVDFRDYVPDILFASTASYNVDDGFQANSDKNLTFDKLNFDPSTLLAGSKFNFRFPHVDFSFSYLYDYDDYYTPEISLQTCMINVRTKGMDLSETQYAMFNGLDIEFPLPFTTLSELNLIRRRVHRFGADIKGAVDRFGLWAELCFNMTDDYLMESYKIRNHSLNFTTGFDFSYGPDDAFYMNFQIVGQVNFNYDDTFYKDYPFYSMFDVDDISDAKMNPADMIDSMGTFASKEEMEKFYYRVLVNKLSASTEWCNLGFALQMNWPVLDNLLKPSITASYMLPIGYDTDYQHRYGCLFVKPELDIQPFDSFHIVIGADLYFSWRKLKDKDVEMYQYDKLGMLHKDSSVYVAVKYKWGMDWSK